jgi:hypothetical protein
MRNIPLAFVDEETLEYIRNVEANRRTEEHPNTIQVSRQPPTSPLALKLKTALRSVWKTLIDNSTWDGPNSMANLERAMSRHRRNPIPR